MKRRRRIELGSRMGGRIWAVAVGVAVVGAAFTWSLLPTPLPKVVRLGAGPVGGRYHQFGEGLRPYFAEHRIDLQIVASSGSKRNIDGLLSGEFDVGLVQSGNLSDEQASQLESVASVFYQPVLVADRIDWHGGSLAGAGIAVGVPGSGTHALATRLLADQGIRDGHPPGTRILEIGGREALEALGRGDANVAVFVTALSVPWVRELFADSRIKVTNFNRAKAYTRHYRFLHELEIPAGVVDLANDLPSEDMQVIATTTSLVVGPGSHRALIYLLIESAREELLQGDLLAGPGEFPSPHRVEAPLSDVARHYFDRGPSFFYRVLPFRWGYVATRAAILLIPLLTILYPLVRSAGPTYRWMIQRRIYRWYKVLRRLELQLDASESREARAKTRRELARVGEEIWATQVPARFGADLFQLRQHHRLLGEQLGEEDPTS